MTCISPISPLCRGKWKERLTNQNTSDLVQRAVQNLLANCVMSTCVVVCCVLLAADQKLWVKEVSVVASSNFVDRRRIKVDENRTRHELAAAGFGEDSIKFTALVEFFGIGIGLPIACKTVFEKVANN